MKNSAQERNFRKIKNQISQIKDIVKHTKTNALWEHDAAIRKKIKELRNMPDKSIRGFSGVYEEYVELLNYISNRLLESHNYKNNTKFELRDIIDGNEDAYINSGIISVLTTHHIPKLISYEFDKIFPTNPKDEYIVTRSLDRKIYLHLGDTNTGKTYNAMQRLKEANKGIYLSPLRILALENYERLNNEGIKCSLLTGEEESIVENATHISSTIEKLNLSESYDIAIIDEIQMIDDYERGPAWSRALLGLKCEEIHVCGALNSKNLLLKILKDCDDEVTIKEYTRQIPLIVEKHPFSSRSVTDGDAIVVFSKRRVLQLAESYSSQGFKCSIIYGDLPPEVRKKQYSAFINKETNLLISTDAIGMGVNLPIRRIIFMDTKKFDGTEFRYLKSQEVKQIAGRAGRLGIYDEGFVSAQSGAEHFIEENLFCEDTDIYSAVIGPSDAILKVTTLPLKEKLALWATRDIQIPYYRKMDITKLLLTLDIIKKYNLSEENQWQLLKIPFDITNEVLINTFTSYIDEYFLSESKELTRPEIFQYDLVTLENYYAMVNLYYSFSKAFNLKVDIEWIYATRLKISDEINNILISI